MSHAVREVLATAPTVPCGLAARLSAFWSSLSLAARLLGRSIATINRLSSLNSPCMWLLFRRVELAKWRLCQDPHQNPRHCFPVTALTEPSHLGRSSRLHLLPDGAVLLPCASPLPPPSRWALGYFWDDTHLLRPPPQLTGAPMCLSFL